VLCVDDEPNVLEGLALNLRRRYEVLKANGGGAGLEILQKDKEIAVIISDMRMPGMNGATFLAEARKLAPHATRILLTGQADLDSAIAAVNEGQIFRFLTKPCPPPILVGVVDAAAEQNRLLLSERVLLEQTLYGSIKALTEILALASPASFGRVARIRDWVSGLSAKLGSPGFWQAEVAAMLSQLGCILLPPEVAEKASSGQSLSGQEQKMAGRVLEVTERMLSDIPRLEVVRGILAASGAAQPARSAAFTPSEQALVQRGAQLLKVALDYDALESREGLDALRTMRATDGYDPAVLDALTSLVEARRAEGVRELPLAAVRAGMVFAADLRLLNGTLLIARGHEVTAGLLERLSNIRPGSVKEPVFVIASQPAAAGQGPRKG
jgi:CheY-like chemotaxis protein